MTKKNEQRENGERDTGEPPKKRAIPWQGIQILGTLAVAAMGVFLTMEQTSLSAKQQQLNEEQQRLSARLESMKATGEFVDTVEQYLDKAELDEESRKEMLISLLNIITQANLSSTGELTEAEKRCTMELMPFHFALVIQNHDMLAHIGYSEESRKIWVPFAKNSGNMKFKTTAIKALSQIGKASEEPADLEYAVSEIVELTRGGRLHDVVPEALSAMKELLVFIDETDLKKGNDSTELIEKTVAMLESISTDLVSGGLSEDGVQTAVDAAGLDDEQVLAIKEESARMAQELSAKLPAESRGSVMDEVKKRVKELQSGDHEERRSAERTLARAGSKAVPTLFESYEQSKGAPKMKSGLTSSLMLMATPVTYNEDQMVVLSKLIGDDDPKVRMNALGALQKITDPDTIRRGAEPMFAWLTNTRNPTGLHNAVGVLCEWDKDPALKDLKIKNKLSATSKLLNTSGDGWEKTLARIEAHLNPKSAEKK